VDTLITAGVGFTVSVYVNEGPVQPFADAVIVYGTLIGDAVELFNASEILFELPVAGGLAIPAMAGLLQLKFAPVTEDVIV
jgi:hypothetical protein